MANLLQWMIFPVKMPMDRGFPRSQPSKKGGFSSQLWLISGTKQRSRPAFVAPSVARVWAAYLAARFKRLGVHWKRLGGFLKIGVPPKSSGINQHNYGLMGFSGIFHHGLWFITKLVYNSNNYGLMAFSGINQHFWEPP